MWEEMLLLIFDCFGVIPVPWESSQSFPGLFVGELWLVMFLSAITILERMAAFGQGMRFGACPVRCLDRLREMFFFPSR